MKGLKYLCRTNCRAFVRFGLGRRLFILFFLLASGAAYSSDEWLADEVLRQLQDIRAEVKALRGEVATLREEVKHLGVGGGNGAARIGTLDVAIDDDPRIGRNDATVAIVEFSDFECPFCTRHNKQTLPQIKDSYVKTGQVMYVMKDFPLAFHAKAKEAAIAGHCAAQQNAYEPMRDALFNNARSLGNDFYLKAAQSQGLDMTKFTACLGDAGAAQEVQSDLEQGMALGVDGTPAFLVGRVIDGKVVDAKMITGAVGFERFQQVVDGLLKQ